MCIGLSHAQTAALSSHFNLGPSHFSVCCAIKGFRSKFACNSEKPFCSFIVFHATPLFEFLHFFWSAVHVRTPPPSNKDVVSSVCLTFHLESPPQKDITNHTIVLFILAFSLWHMVCNQNITWHCKEVELKLAVELLIRCRVIN